MPELRWLEEKEQNAWRAFIVAYSKLSAALDHHAQRDAGIPLAHYEILAWLSDRPDGEMRMSELADDLGRSRSRLSHSVRRLEQRGWVARVPVPSDGRGQMARLLPAGYEVLEKAAPGHVQAVRELFIDQLSPGQLERMEQACRRVTENLGAHQRTR